MSLVCDSRYSTTGYPWISGCDNYMDGGKERKRSKWQEEDDEYEFDNSYWRNQHFSDEQQYAKYLITENKATPGMLRYIYRSKLVSPDWKPEQMNQGLVEKEELVTFKETPPCEHEVIRKVNYNDLLEEEEEILEKSEESDEWNDCLEELEEIPEDAGFYLSDSKPYSTKDEIPQGALVTYVPCLVGGGREKRNHRKRRMRRGRGRGGEGRRSDKVYIQQLGVRNPATMTQFKENVLDEWRYEFNIAADGGGTFSYYYSLRDPLRAVQSSGTYERADKLAKLYDEFKVISTTLTVNFVTLNVQQGVITLAADYDTIASGTYTPTDLRDNQYMRKASPPNMLSYVIKEVPLSEGTYRGTAAAIHQRGWYDFNSPPEEGSGYICGESFPSGSAVARCVLTQRVRLRRRRTVEQARKQRLRAKSV